jgi:hypothetical protein
VTPDEIPDPARLTRWLLASTAQRCSARRPTKWFLIFRR